MRIKWIKNISITIFEDKNDTNGEFIEVKKGEMDIIDIIGTCDNDHVDMKFDDGSIALGVPNLVYKVIEK